MTSRLRFFSGGNLRLLFYGLLLLTLSCTSKQPSLLAMKALENYPSGSGLAFYNDRVYMIGDDAADLLAMDTGFNVVSRVPVFQSGTMRIAKETKADLESVTVINYHQRPALLLTGSGSLSPARDVCWIIDSNHQKQEYPLTVFYDRLRRAGLPDLNIEGAATLPFGSLLAIRGNKSFPKNFLVLTDLRFWESQEKAAIKLIKLGRSGDSTDFSGVSGLDYSYHTDQLFITMSTEDTRNNYDDGAIGKSYLWIINDVSSKRKWTAVNPDRIIDLEAVDKRFKGNKIESVCVTIATPGKQELVLVADDDKGGTVLFRLSI